MGENIEQKHFSDNELIEFQTRLRKETQVLMKMFEYRSFAYSEVPLIGLEVEAWLVDQQCAPFPANQQFLSHCDDSDIVEELAQFNFELNTSPVPLKGSCLSQLATQIKKTWENSKIAANKCNVSPCMIGIHPLVNDELLRPEYMSDCGRYKALNEQILNMRQGQPIHIDIQGKDHFNTKLNHIMMEAAATSVQVHIQANQENIRRVYNASLLTSIPSVAIAANSPYFYGHDLWDETRIPLFEQAIRIASFRDKKGNDIGRVTFGTGYVRNSLFEIYLENLDGYPPLIPALFNDDREKLHHLNFHNGTLWRWNRPIVGFNTQGIPHLRVEQRVMASGPSLIDIISNVAFSVGLTQYLANQDKAPEESMTFTDCNKNFYLAAKDGLRAKIKWFGKTVTLGQLITEELIPKAKKGLEIFNLDKHEIEYYLDDIIGQRVQTQQNGSFWQRAYIETHRKCFNSLSKQYLENQESGKPVHLWKI